MGKSTKKKNKKITAPKANIQELSISRDGGQIALRGYSYQFLYSCYLILSSSNPSNFFQLEGIEDIDCIMQKNGSNDITPVSYTHLDVYKRQLYQRGIMHLNKTRNFGYCI